MGLLRGHIIFCPNFFAVQLRLVFTANLFWAAFAGSEGILSSDSFCKSKVNYFKFPIFSTNYIVEFDVPVYYLLGVNVIESLNNVQDDSIVLY